MSKPKIDTTYIKYACGCQLGDVEPREFRFMPPIMPARLCAEHSRGLIAVLSMNGRYVDHHNARGERSIVTWEPIATRSNV